VRQPYASHSSRIAFKKAIMDLQPVSRMCVLGRVGVARRRRRQLAPCLVQNPTAQGCGIQRLLPGKPTEKVRSCEEGAGLERASERPPRHGAEARGASDDDDDDDEQQRSSETGSKPARRKGAAALRPSHHVLMHTSQGSTFFFHYFPGGLCIGMHTPPRACRTIFIPRGRPPSMIHTWLPVDSPSTATSRMNGRQLAPTAHNDSWIPDRQHGLQWAEDKLARRKSDHRLPPPDGSAGRRAQLLSRMHQYKSTTATAGRRPSVGRPPLRAAQSLSAWLRRAGCAGHAPTPG
jgi:hypothetical protein